MARSPIIESPAWVEQQAGRITDPVERLRFLRQRKICAQLSRTHRRRTGLGQVASLIAGLLVLVEIVPVPTGTAETFVKHRTVAVGGDEKPSVAPLVWLVEVTNSLEVYSNGLRVDLKYAVANRPRRPFPIYPLTGGTREQATGNAPVGIVYHTTESNLAPFEEEENRKLRQLGRNLIEVVRLNRSYHYVIDRFGRAYRVVQEADAANHVGTSIWADGRGVYVNLNDSFLGVSFEGQTGAIDEVTAAQVATAKVLTEMLRARYSIPAENCVTHAQVSVNPRNMRIGEHTDWAGKFPFAEVGLPDNYSIPLPSLCVFGFEYDRVFLRVTGTRWRGLDLAELQVARRAAAEGLETSRYRAVLQHRYKDIESALEEQGKGGS
ncbi:MAG: peptidoglycan recognition family protein [Bryobacteraceae bacterium]